MKRTFKIYRYDPDKDAKPYMQTVQVELDGLNQRAVWLMQSLLDANAVIDPRQLVQSGQDNALSWTLRAYPHTSSAQATAANRLVLYTVDIHVQSHQGRQWQLQTLRPLLQLDGAKSQ